jgi:hypothetical protein
MASGPAIKVGDRVELHLGTGEVVIANVHQVTAGQGKHDVLTTRLSKWSRWSGTQSDIIELITEAQSLLSRKALAKAPVEITVDQKKGARSVYSNQDALKKDFDTLVHNKDYLRLRSIASIRANIGPAGEQQFSAILLLQNSSPGAALTVSGADKVDVEGLKGSLSEVVAQGKMRIPAPNMVAYYFIGATLGWLYAAIFAGINFSFLPDNWIGNLILGALYILGYGGLLYVIILLPRSLWPPLRLVKTGTKTLREIWLPRVPGAIGATAAALLPFFLGLIFTHHGS